MSWSTRRRLIILGIVIGIVGAGGAGLGYFTLHKAPSCTDGIKNGKEAGIDCGGICAFTCTAGLTPPSVRFVRSLSSVPGRTDVIAYVDNPNHDSATRHAPYTIDLYDDANVLIARTTGSTPIPAGASVPVFESNFFSGSRAVAHVFLTFATSSIPWFKVNTPSPLPKVVSIEVTGTNAPRVTATVMNPTASAMTNVPFIVTIFGEDGNAIGASRTVALSIPPQGQADLVFTWPTPFVGTVSKIEIVPIILPTP